MHDLSTAPGVLAYLAGTPFASETATPLSGGSSHFTFRLYLTAPYAGRLTLVLKHAKPYVARIPSWKYDEERQVFASNIC